MALVTRAGSVGEGPKVERSTSCSRRALPNGSGLSVHPSRLYEQVVESKKTYNAKTMDWRTKINANRRVSTRVSRNGQIVLPAQTRRAAGIEPGDTVVAVPVAPGAVMVEKVKGTATSGLREHYEDPANPLRGIWGSDPDKWLEEIRGAWSAREIS